MEKSIDKLIASLAIVEENVVGEALKQPKLFIDAARYRVECMRKRSQAEAELISYKSKIALAIRARKNEAGEKVTEGTIAETVEAQPKMADHRKAMEDGYAEEELAKLLLEAFRMKRDMIRVVADSQGYEGAREEHEAERMHTRKKLREQLDEVQARRKHAS